MCRRLSLVRQSGVSAWLTASWLALLSGVIIMSIWAAIDDRFPGDVTVGQWIQANDLPGRMLSQFLRDVGSTPASAVTLILVVIALFAIGYRRSAVVSGCFAIGFGLQRGIKLLVDRPRTSILFLEQYGAFDSPSFPSGHVMSSAIAGLVVAYICWHIPGPLWLRIPITTWGIGVGLLQPWASISAGVHWPSDTLGGFVWAAVICAPLILALGQWALPADSRDRHHRRRFPFPGLY